MRLAAAGELPGEIDEHSDISVSVFRELYEARLIDAVDGCSMGGDAFLEPRITVRGREYLNELEQRASAASPAGRARRIGALFAAWVAGVLMTVIATWIIARFGLA